MAEKVTFKTEMGYLATAITFLTRFPVSKWSIQNETSLLSATVYFPLVGIFVGILIGSAYLGAGYLWDHNIAIILAISASLIITGAFHEDGFADVCDSMGAFDAEKKLTIMKDSRLGTYGVCGLICLFIVKFYAMKNIVVNDQNLVAIIVLAHCVSRYSCLPLIYFNPYVSANSKSGKDLIANTVNQNRLILASLFTTVVLIFLASGHLVSLVFGLFGVLSICHWYFRKTFGGITGDCLGAANQLTEITILLIFALK